MARGKEIYKIKEAKKQTSRKAMPTKTEISREVVKKKDDYEIHFHYLLEIWKTFM